MVTIVEIDSCTVLVVSNSNNRAILVTDGLKGDSSTVMSDEPYLKLVKREMFGKTYLSAEPINYGADKKCPPAQCDICAQA
jgi:hypothetical protein